MGAGGRRAHLGRSGWAQRAPELQHVLQVHGAQWQAERAQCPVLGEAPVPGAAARQSRPATPPSPPGPARTHVEGAGLLEHGAQRARVHLCLMCAPGVRGQAQAGIGVRCAARGPGPQVRSLLEAHPDLAGRGPSPVSPAPPSTGRPPFTRHPSKIPRILWDPLTSWLPESYSRDSCRHPTAGHPQVQMPRYPTPAAPEWCHENADRCVGTLCPSEPSPRRQQVHGGADLQATRRPPFSQPCETGRHAPQSTSQATAFLRNLCGSPWPEPLTPLFVTSPAGKAPTSALGRPDHPGGGAAPALAHRELGARLSPGGWWW